MKLFKARAYICSDCGSSKAHKRICLFDLSSNTALPSTPSVEQEQFSLAQLNKLSSELILVMKEQNVSLKEHDAAIKDLK